MAGLKLIGVKKDYGNVKTLHGIDLTIKDGEFIVFVGPSGCGKSTLLRSICGLEEISAGDLYIGDKRTFTTTIFRIFTTYIFICWMMKVVVYAI